MQSSATTVNAYFAELPAEKAAVLSELRQAIHEARPEVVEVMRYGMPVFESGGEMLCSIAAQKSYFAFYRCESITEQTRAELPKCNVGKGCVRFKKAEHLRRSWVVAHLRNG